MNSKPTLTQDGLTLVRHSWARRNETVDQFVDRTLKMAQTMGLERFSYCEVVKEAEEWEYNYVKPRCTFEEYKALRAPYVGATRIFGNFLEVSHCFDLYTRNRELIDAFCMAFVNNSNAEAIRAYHAEGQARSDKERRIFPKLKEAGYAYTYP